jgi:hypothetical protein
MEVLSDRQTAKMCLRFAALERKLGEIDRARAIYAHASQFCDPRTNPEFWAEWHTFEIDTGSEDTFREMLRIYADGHTTGNITAEDIWELHAWVVSHSNSVAVLSTGISTKSLAKLFETAVSAHKASATTSTPLRPPIPPASSRLL